MRLPLWGGLILGVLLGPIVGGALFGVGMMLAGGCPSRLIVRAAQGQGAALLTWLVFVLAPVRELLSGPPVQLPAASLPALLGGVPAWAVTAGVLALMALFLFSAPQDSAWRGGRLPLAGALLARQFAWARPTGAQMLRNLAGGVLMAVGCTIGQGMAGVATLSVSSLLAVAAMVLGAWLAHRVLPRTATA